MSEHLCLNLRDGKDRFEAGSIAYKEAGAATRLAFQRATRLRIKQSEWRVLAAVIGLTLSRSKYYDRTYVAQIAEHAGLDRTDHTLKCTKKALKSLRELRIISYDPATKHGEMTVVGVALGAAL